MAKIRDFRDGGLHWAHYSFEGSLGLITAHQNFVGAKFANIPRTVKKTKPDIHHKLKIFGLGKTRRGLANTIDRYFSIGGLIMTKTVIVLAQILVLATSVFAQTPTQSSETKVDQIFAQWDKPGSPGCALAVIKDGRTIYERAYGTGNLELDTPRHAEH